MRTTFDNRKKRGARLGQHFLTQPAIAEALVSAVSISHKDTVLEIGPGKGILTRAILATGARVVAVEKDPLLAQSLPVSLSRATGHQSDIRVVEDDIRNVTPEMLGLHDREYVLAANIPYYITGEIIRQFLTARVQPKTMALLIQKEVADRIVARDGKESLLSLSVKAYGVPRIVKKVPPGNFSPPPSVDSAIIVIEQISRDFFNDLSVENFFMVLHAGFAAKRKHLVGNLAKVWGRERAAAALRAAALDEKVRAEDLSLATWKNIVLALNL